MRNAVGEWILSLVLREDRAGAVVGDLAEARLGAAAFWWAVMTTAAAIAVRNPTRVCVRVAGLAIEVGGFAFSMWFYTRVIGIACVTAAAVVIPVELVLWWWRRVHHEAHGDSTDGTRGHCG